MKYLDDQVDNIKRARTLIAHLESQPSLDLAGNCKELGDTCINLCRDMYAASAASRETCSAWADESVIYYKKAIKHYQKAFELRKDNQTRLDGMYARFALGNAWKERPARYETSVARRVLPEGKRGFQRMFQELFCGKRFPFAGKPVCSASSNKLMGQTGDTKTQPKTEVHDYLSHIEVVGKQNVS